MQGLKHASTVCFASAYLQLNEDPELLAEVNTTARLTCLTVRQIGGATEEDKASVKQTAVVEEEKASPKQLASKRSKPSEKQGKYLT